MLRESNLEPRKVVALKLLSFWAGMLFVRNLSANTRDCARELSGCCSLSQAGAHGVVWRPLVSRFPPEVLG